MKKFIILLFIIQSTLIFADYPIMLEIQSKEKVSNDFRDGVEEVLTSLNYSLVDEKAQEEALKNQSEQRDSECYDDSCLVDTGKMLAAKSLIIVEVEKKDIKSYKFKVRFVDFEKGTTTRTVSKYYEFSLNNYKEMMKFGKTLTKALLVNYKVSNTIDKKPKIVKQEKKKIENKENKKLKEKIEKLKEQIEAKTFNPRKKYRWGLFGNILAPTILGGGLTYRLNPSIDLSLYLGVFTGLGVDYHLFANSTKAYTWYTGLDISVAYTSELNVMYPHIGYQYIAQNGFSFAITAGIAIITYDEYYEQDGEYVASETDILPMGGIKLGYSF